MQSRKMIMELLDTKAIEIESTNKDYPFSKSQVDIDSIDLRLGEYFYVIKDKYEYINTLKLDAIKSSELFEKIDLDANGYVLKPQEIIFAPSLEIVKMQSFRHCGFITGRSVYSRLGLTINCTMSKFGYGMDSVVSLQIINHSTIGLKIFPRQKLFTMEIHEIVGYMDPYKGLYTGREYTLPVVRSDELDHYSQSDKITIDRDTPKLVKKKRTYNYNRLNKYFKIKQAFTGLLGIGGFVTFLTTDNLRYIITILFCILFVIDYFFSTFGLMGVNSDELD